jgi:tight adherence protein B
VSAGGLAPVLALIAGALAGAVAVTELGRILPAVGRLGDALIAAAVQAVHSTLGPLERAASEGSDPSAPERRRLRVAGAAVGAAGGWLLGGGRLALVAAVVAAAMVPRAAQQRRLRYGRRVERGAAQAALSISGALAGGGSIRAAITSAATELNGPIALELGRTAVELEAGASVDAALDGLVARAPSGSVVLICAAIQLQRRSGGDLAALLRRIAASLEDEQRATEEARAATAQARVTSTIVLALPPAGILLAELASPGLLGRILASPIGAAFIATALGLQALGAVAIRRLARMTA